MRRVMVIGGSGSGKSTFAAALGARLGIRTVHMDALFWRPGWVEAPEAEFVDAVRAAIAKAAWVMDGNYSRTWPERLCRADTVIFLDPPTWLRLWRVAHRTWRHYGQTRPDLGEACPERFDPGFIFGWVLKYRWRGRRKAIGLVAPDGPAGHLQRIQLRSAGAARRFLDSLPEQKALT